MKKNACDFCSQYVKNCEQCNELFMPRKDKLDTARFCSKICQMKKMGQISQKSLHEKWAQEDEIESLRERFESHVKKNSEGCWSWDAATRGKIRKYGVLTFRGKEMMAHRASYLIHRGPIPDNLWVLHKCDNPPCTNPDHLWLGTPLENQRDKMEKGRHKGEKLNPEKVKEIKALLKTKILRKEICSQYDISRQTLISIKKGKTWKDIE